MSHSTPDTQSLRTGQRSQSQYQDEGLAGLSPDSQNWSTELERLGWQIPNAVQDLLDKSYVGPRREVWVSPDHTIWLFGTSQGEVAGSREASHIEAGLRGLGESPEVDGIREIHLVEELGSFIDPTGARIRPIRALPPDSLGRVLLARWAAESPERINLLFSEHVERERWATTGEACQVRERTILAQVRLAKSSQLEPGLPNARFGEYQGRPIIGRDSRITGGVYVSGTGKRPAIVVDPTRDPRLEAVYEALRRWVPYWRLVSLLERGRDLAGRSFWGARRGHLPSQLSDDPTPGQSTLPSADPATNAGSETDRTILQKVYDLTRERLPTWEADDHGGQSVDDAVVEAIRRRGKVVRANQKIYLGEYLRIAGQGGRGGGGGECVHQSLLAGHLLERLANDGATRGQISFERNRIYGMGSHAWVRFTTQRDRVWVLDPAQSYLGPVESRATWLYMRAEDIGKLRQRPL